MQILTKRQPALMTKKFYSMLLGGTLTSMVLSVLLMSDSFIAGAIIGSDAVAAVTLVMPLYSLAAFFSAVISLGVPVLYSREMGEFNKQGANQVFGVGVLMSVIVGIVLFLLTGVLGEMYLLSSSPSAEILDQAKEYLFWMRFTILVVPMQTLINAAVYGDGDETLSTVAYAVQGLGNIAFSIILGNIMGIGGIGLASFLFNAVSILILMVHFAKKSNSLHFNVYFSFGVLKDIVRHSIIDSSSYLFLAAITGTLNAFIGAQYGAKYLILVSGISLCREFLLLFEGIGEAVGPIFGVYIGEQNRKGLCSSYALAKRTAIIEGIAVTLFLIVAAPFVPGFLNVENPELARLVTDCIRFYALGTTFVSLLYLITSYYLVIEQITLGVVASALRDLVMGIGLAVLLGRIFGLYGMFIGLAIAPVFAYALLMLYLTLRYGKNDCPMLLSKVPVDNRSYIFNLSVEPEKIIDVQKNVEALLVESNVDHRTVGKVKLLIEELYMLIREKNGDKNVLSELTVFLRPEEIRLITKDDGILFDISEADVDLTSIAAFAVSSYMEKLGQDKRHLTTMSFNRSAFVVKARSV